jgi:hypothetical protein
MYCVGIALVASASPERGLFSSPEHQTVGNAVKFDETLADGSNYSFDGSKLMTLKDNRGTLTYGDAILSCGDVYAGDWKNPICLGATDAEKESRFLTMFESLGEVGNDHPKSFAETLAVTLTESYVKATLTNPIWSVYLRFVLLLRPQNKLRIPNTASCVHELHIHQQASICNEQHRPFYEDCCHPRAPCVWQLGGIYCWPCRSAEGCPGSHLPHRRNRQLGARSHYECLGPSSQKSTHFVFSSFELVHMLALCVFTYEMSACFQRFPLSIRRLRCRYISIVFYHNREQQQQQLPETALVFV